MKSTTLPPLRSSGEMTADAGRLALLFVEMRKNCDLLLADDSQVQANPTILFLSP
jgi:hypothetical protein